MNTVPSPGQSVTYDRLPAGMSATIIEVRPGHGADVAIVERSDGVRDGVVLDAIVT